MRQMFVVEIVPDADVLKSNAIKSRVERVNLKEPIYSGYLSFFNDIKRARLHNTRKSAEIFAEHLKAYNTPIYKCFKEVKVIPIEV